MFFFQYSQKFIFLLGCLAPFSSSTWVHFFRESFLVDFNYKILFSFFISRFVFRGAYLYNYFFFYTTQLFGSYSLILLNTNLTTLFGTINSFFFFILRFVSLLYLLCFLIF